MARSLKKGPYIDEKLYARIEELNRTRQKKVLKTWSRRSTIAPEFVGHTLAVHNGKKRSESTRLNSSHIQKSRMPSSA